MQRQESRTLTRLILIAAVALIWVVYPGFGQNGNGQGQNGNNQGQNGQNGNNAGKEGKDGDWQRLSGIVCKPGQARCVTQDHRWLAAAKRADRRASTYRKSPSKSKGHN